MSATRKPWASVLNSGGCLGRVIRRTVALVVPAEGLRDSGEAFGKRGEVDILHDFDALGGRCAGGHVLTTIIRLSTERTSSRS